MNISFTNKKNLIAVGRGAVAIYLALVCEQLKEKKVLLPANICYAAVFPVLLSGNKPVFCDVNKNTGNVDLECIETAFEDGIAAAVIPHMYGNPVKNMSEIVDFLHGKGVVVIEDCASALGAQIGDRFVGDFGDYSVYSFGHSKTIDIGNGGLLASDRSLDTAYAYNEQLQLYSEEIEKDNDFFSKIYRVIRNNPNPDWSRRIYKALAEKSEDMYLYRIDEKFKKMIKKSVSDFQNVVDRRRIDVELYRNMLHFNQNLREYEFEYGASPWRFNVFVEPSVKARLISYLLENDIPVSDWYPRVTDIFFEEKSFFGAEYMEKRILNFPLMIEKKEIERICSTINRFFKG